MKVIYEDTDGTVCVLSPSVEALKIFTVEEIADRDVPAGRNFFIVEDSAISADRTFRDVWETVSAGIRVNEEGARKTAHDRRRVDRVAFMSPLASDVTVPKLAVETNAKRDAYMVVDDARQVAIDEAEGVAQIKSAMQAEGWVG
jgi:hypothetical protein